MSATAHFILLSVIQQLMQNKFVALLTFATKEAKSGSPWLTWGCAVIKIFEKATEAFTATIVFLLQFSESLLSIKIHLV